MKKEIYFGEITKDTQVEENNIFQIEYENEVNEIIIKTSKPLTVGTIWLQNKKAIKETMTQANCREFFTKHSIYGMNTLEEEPIYQFEKEKVTEIKNSETRIDVSVDQTNWTNEVQNEVNITATLVANSERFNLFKNPIIEIKLPTEVEKVILGESSLLYENGLRIKNTEIVEKDNSKVIRIELEGTQQQYFNKSIIEGTNVLIPATIIIKEDIQNVESHITWTYTNEQEESNGYDAQKEQNQKIEVNIKSFMAKESQEDEEIQFTDLEETEEEQEDEQKNQLEVKTEAIIGNKVLKDGDIVHEKQIIKYCVTVANPSSEKITGIDIQGQIPEGTTYGTIDRGTYLLENYEYIKDESVTTYTLPITEIEAGEVKKAFYEVVVDELKQETSKDIVNTITTKIKDTIYHQEVKNNVVEKAELEVFVKSYIGRDVRNSFFYYFDITNLTDNPVNHVTIETNQLQKELSFVDAIFYDEYGMDENGDPLFVGEINEENKYVATIDKIEAGQTRTILVRMIAQNFEDKVNECPLSMTLYVNTDDTQTYISNENRRMSYPEYVTATQKLNKEGENVLPGETVEYKYVIKNESKIKTVVDITDKYSEHLEDVIVQYDAYDVLVSDPETRVPSDTYYDLEEEENVQYNRIPQKINVSELQDQNVFQTSMILPAGKTLEITVTATASEVNKTTEIENYMVVSGEMIKTTSTNLSKFTILLEEDSEEDIIPDDDDEDDIGDDNPDHNTPEDPDNPEGTEKHHISGVVWKDKNQDGVKQSQEETLENVPVKLYNADTNTSIQVTTTKENGKYEFKDIVNGNYLVVFEYDTKNYVPTKFTSYQTSKNSSNAMKKTITINGQPKTVGITDIIPISDTNIENLNMGLVENNIFDLKLDKYISKITVKNDTTKTYQYNNEKLAKIEIPTKQIDKTQVQIEYKIVVTNEGNVGAYVDEVIDYVEQDLQILDSANNGWKKDAKGNLVNNSLVGKKIEPGESQELKLMVTKKMTQQNTGTIVNTAEIKASKSAENLKDIDSVAGNRKAEEDDYSEANVIISIKTGLVKNMIIAIVGIGLLILVIIGIRKIKNRKMMTFILLLAIIVSTSNIASGAYQVYISGSSSPFKGADGGLYVCQDPGKSQCSGGHHLYELYDTERTTISTIKTEERPTQIDSSKTTSTSQIEDTYNADKSAKEGMEIYEGLQIAVKNDKFDSYEITVSYIPEGKYDKDKDKEENERYRTSKNAEVYGITNIKNAQEETIGKKFNIKAPKRAKEINVAIKLTVNRAYKIQTKENVEEYFKCIAISGVHGSKNCHLGPSWVQRTKKSREEITETYEDKEINKTIKVGNTEKGKIRVIKTDKVTGEVIPKEGDIGLEHPTTRFKIYRKDSDGKIRYMKYQDDGSTNILFVSKDEADDFGISDRGYKSFKNIPVDDNVTYYLVETEAKDGYQKLKEPIELKIADSDVSRLRLRKRGLGFFWTRPVVKKAMRDLCTENGELKSDRYRKYIYNMMLRKEPTDEIDSTVKNDLREIELSDIPTNEEIKKLVNFILEKEEEATEWIDELDPDLDQEENQEKIARKIQKRFVDPLGIHVSSGDIQATVAYLQGFTPNIVKNEKDKGWLKIEKIDEDTEEPLKGAEFKIYGEDVEGNKVSINETTNDKGIIFIELKTGEYTIEEVKAPPGYELKYQVTKHEDVKININHTKEKPYDIVWTNKRYVSLSGYVWEDIAFQETGKTQKPNGLYQNSEYDTNDKKLSGIEVTLMNAKTGKPVQIEDSKGNLKPVTQKTNQKGEYTFEKIELDELENYYIEFQYNGMSYESVNPNIDKENGSKATEGNNRKSFNSGYETIEYQTSNKYPLTYDETVEHESKLLYRADRNTQKYNYGYTDESGRERDPVSGVDSQYMIKANTKNVLGAKNLTGIKIPITKDGKTKLIEATPDNIRKNNITKIKNINLGIQERTKIDLALMKDLYSVKVSINGTENIYPYADRFKNVYDGQTGYEMDPKVKFAVESEYGSISYTRSLYPSDIHYKGSEKLKVEVTYKIGIRNHTGEKEIITTINELTDYYDNKYEYIRSGKEINLDGTVKDDNSVKVTSSEKQEEYTKVTIEPSLPVKGEEESVIYMQFEVKPDRIVEILGNNEEIVKLDNIVEITSYSSKKNDEIYAAIDRDSQPGNLNIDDKNTYEDDTDKAPGLKLELQEERKITGMVFLDTTNTETTGNGLVIRQGDGKYDRNNDQVVKGVDVKLVKVDDEGEIQGIAKRYEKGGKETEIKIQTDETGKFELTGFIPDNYQIVYTWGGQRVGNNIIRVQDYKNTIVDKNKYESKLMNKEWYKIDPDDQLSDALDNYTEREAIDKQSSNVINANKQAIENYHEDGKIITKDNTNGEKLITQINAKTPTFKVNIEYDNEIVKRNPNLKYENHLRNIDFGIAKRPEQTLELKKHVRNAKIILTNGNTLIEVEMDKEGNLKNQTKHVTYIERSGVNGQIKMEVDSELLQSAQLKVEYDLTVKNSSELDYNNEEYYYYGKGHGQNEAQKVQLKAEQIIDYMDESISIGKDNTIGTVISKEKYTNELKNKGLIENSFDMNKWLESKDRVFVIGNGDNNYEAELLKPGEETREPILFIGTRLLSDASLKQGIEMENIAEIIQIHKTGGATITTTPGSYIPSKEGTSEEDNSEAEFITIMPPTGLTIDYIAYTLIAITSLGVLVLGIMLIKKIVLK